MKQIIISICLVAIAVILVYVFIPDRKEVAPSQGQDVELLKAQNERLQEELYFSAQVIDSLLYENARRDTVEKTHKKEIAVYKARLVDSTAKIKQLAREVLALQSNDGKDSIADELARQVLVLIDLYREQGERYDSLVAVMDSSASDFEAVELQYRDSNKSLLTAYNNVYKLYAQLLIDTQSLEKSLRRQKLKTKVAGVLGIIGTGAALLK